VIPADLWDELDADTSAPGIIRRRVMPESSRDLFVAVDHPSRHRVLILRVANDALEHPDQLPSTKALQTSIVEFDEHRSELHLRLVLPEITHVFGAFVDDVVEAAARTDSDSAALDALIRRVDTWRRLLEGRDSILTGNTAQGLWGELWILLHLLHPVFGDSVLRHWTGPQRESHDFQFDRLAIEVKTTRGSRPNTVRISGERQLDPGSFDDLLLITMSVDALTHGQGLTIPQLVASVRTTLDESLHPLLGEGLLNYGFLEADAGRYATRYTVREVRIYAVTNGFPRLIESDLLAGIGDVRYLLALDACENWRLDDVAFQQRIASEHPT
jgi:hypothetical protein